ncbi:hypothetical protein HHK36_013110 [Tetracentron sinense]|uniref:DUF4283 domain-containing protein n=1 Tax=Tetracentron sinense TaxID=13715 RepID=A0A834ZBN1_TETSI|nr:hypothetical protein HHK36_013110 [Tetracentron sinense]
MAFSLGGLSAPIVCHYLEASHIRRAAEIADKSVGFTSSQPNFGYVIAMGGNLVGEGYLYAQGQSVQSSKRWRLAETCKDVATYLNMEPRDCHGDQIDVSALVKGERRDEIILRITEENRRGLRHNLWVPEEVVGWMARTVQEFAEARGYCFRKFRGRKCSLVGEKRSNSRGAFRGWDGAVVCLIGRPQTEDDWEEVAKIISKLLPEEEHIVVFPFQAHQAIYHSKNASQLSVLCRSFSVPVGTSNIVRFQRWCPTSNSLSVSNLNKPRWIAVKGIPFHLWVPVVLDKNGAICGGLLEVHPSTVEQTDLSFVKIKVDGDLNLVPRVVSIVFHSISYPLEISIWEELCENCQMWPEAMEIQYCRSWIEAKGGSSETMDTRVDIGRVSNTNLNVVLAKHQSDSVVYSREYTASKQEVRSEPPTLPMNSSRVLVDKEEGKNKKIRKKRYRNRKRSFRRTRLRWRRRIVEPSPPVGGYDALERVCVESRVSREEETEEEEVVMSPLIRQVQAILCKHRESPSIFEEVERSGPAVMELGHKRKQDQASPRRKTQLLEASSASPEGKEFADGVIMSNSDCGGAILRQDGSRSIEKCNIGKNHIVQGAFSLTADCSRSASGASRDCEAESMGLKRGAQYRDVREQGFQQILGEGVENGRSCSGNQPLDAIFTLPPLTGRLWEVDGASTEANHASSHISEPLIPESCVHREAQVTECLAKVQEAEDTRGISSSEEEHVDTRGVMESDPFLPSNREVRAREEEEEEMDVILIVDAIIVMVIATIYRKLGLDDIGVDEIMPNEEAVDVEFVPTSLGLDDIGVDEAINTPTTRTQA